MSPYYTIPIHTTVDTNIAITNEEEVKTKSIVQTQTRPVDMILTTGCWKNPAQSIAKLLANLFNQSLSNGS